jgi:hypothetical protein
VKIVAEVTSMAEVAAMPEVKTVVADTIMAEGAALVET